MAFGMAIAGRHGMAQVGHQGMRLGGLPEGWVVVFSGGSAYFHSTLLAGDEIHVDWGDGTSNTYTSGGVRQHTYADNEEYTVTISGAALKVWFQGANTLLKRVLPCDPVKLLRNNDISYGFSACTGLTSLGSGLFSNAPLLTRADWCFINCYSLTSLPDTLFSNTPALTDASYCFYACSGLTSLPDTLFSNTPLLTRADFCFMNCSGLTSLPDTLFSNTPALTNVTRCFNNCTALTSLGSGLFSNTPALIYASGCFTGCTGLISLPSGIFGNAPELTTVHSCFRECTSLTSIPSGIFGNTPALIMNSCFDGCSEVTGSIPALWTNPNITSYYRCYFHTGKQLTASPNWSHSVSNICAAACADPSSSTGWTGGQWTWSGHCNC